MLHIDETTPEERRTLLKVVCPECDEIYYTDNEDTWVMGICEDCQDYYHFDMSNYDYPY